MASVKFSAQSTASAATSIVVALGGTPAIGDLVLVFLGVDSEIVTHQPGYNTTNTWFKLEGVRGSDTSTLSAYYHTWNFSDSGTSVTFTFSAAPTLGVGDKDLSTVNAIAIAVVMNGASGTAVLAHLNNQSYDTATTPLQSTPLKKTATFALYAAYTHGTSTLTDSDGTATLVQNHNLTAQSLTVWSVASPAVGYNPTFTTSTITPVYLQVVALSDNLPQLYNPPFLEEGPISENRLMFRYKLFRYYTILNNSGTFSAKRYISTDDFSAATQTFVNNQSITSTDRTNLLNSGVGGDFLAQS